MRLRSKKRPTILSTRMFFSVGDYGVPYLILELADADVRTLVRVSKRFDLAWLLRSLHHVATGLNRPSAIDARTTRHPGYVVRFVQCCATCGVSLRLRRAATKPRVS
jgi:hypothetical protein